MRAEQSIQSKDCYKVSQWKWNIDEGSPWWKRFYFKHVFLRFILFSLRLGIPTPKEVEVESDENGCVRRLFRWFEDEGIFDDADQAAAGCLGEHWGYTRLPYGRLMPPDSAQYSGTVFPRKKKDARKWAKPTFPYLIKDRNKEEQDQQTWQEALRKLNQVLD